MLGMIIRRSQIPNGIIIRNQAYTTSSLSSKAKKQTTLAEAKLSKKDENSNKIAATEPKSEKENRKGWQLPPSHPILANKITMSEIDSVYKNIEKRRNVYC